VKYNNADVRQKFAKTDIQAGKKKAERHSEKKLNHTRESLRPRVLAVLRLITNPNVVACTPAGRPASRP
jgi:hypothetical protein